MKKFFIILTVLLLAPFQGHTGKTPPEFSTMPSNESVQKMERGIVHQPHDVQRIETQNAPQTWCDRYGPYAVVGGSAIIISIMFGISQLNPSYCQNGAHQAACWIMKFLGI